MRRWNILSATVDLAPVDPLRTRALGLPQSIGGGVT
jgi:hypothetical protein